jgi:transcriptional regulator with XRE-family HTH domain
LDKYAINKRVKQIMESENLSQAKFGELLGVSRSVIANIVYERTEPSHLFLNHLCSTFNISEEWLRTGEGDMHTMTKNDALLAESLAKIATTDDEKIHQIVTNLCYLDEKYVDMVCDLIANLAEDQKKAKKEK